MKLFKKIFTKKANYIYEIKYKTDFYKDLSEIILAKNDARAIKKFYRMMEIDTHQE